MAKIRTQDTHTRIYYTWKCTDNVSVIVGVWMCECICVLAGWLTGMSMSEFANGTYLYFAYWHPFVDLNSHCQSLNDFGNVKINVHKWMYATHTEGWGGKALTLVDSLSLSPSFTFALSLSLSHSRSHFFVAVFRLFFARIFVISVTFHSYK